MTPARVPDGFASRWCTVRGLRLHALESADGRGSPVLLLPGLVTASRSMIPLARALVARGLRVRILDPPGFGYSDKPRRAVSVAEQAWLVADWLAATGGRPAGVLGNSFGSQIAAALAACRPGAVDRVVLLSPTLAPARRRRLRWLGEPPPPPGADSLAARGKGRWRVRVLARLHGVLDDHRALGGEPPLRVLNVAEYACASLPRAVGTLRGAALEPIERTLPRVGAPVLVLRADGDRLSALDWAQRLAGLAPDGRLARLPGLGHDAFYADPAAVAAVAAPFLAAAGG